MPKIIELKPKSKRPGAPMVMVLDDGETFEVHADAISRKAFRAGDMILEADLAAIVAETEGLRCRDAAWRLLSTRPRSSRELLLALRKRKFAQTIAQSVVDDLVSKGFINDEAFAVILAEEQLRKKKGSGFIKRDLRARGIEQETVDQIMEDLSSPDSERENARALMIKWNRRANPTDPMKRKRAAIGFLTRKGYSPEIVFEIVRGILGEGDEDPEIS